MSVLVMLSPPSAKTPAAAVRRAFTLVELLVVMAVIVAMLSLVGPAVNAMKGANDMDRAVGDIGSMFQICRSYAIANNTYVYLGIGEFDASVAPTAVQTPATSNRGGRIAMVAIASRDGTRHYSPFASSSADVVAGWTDTAIGYNNGANFKAITKIQQYDNLHMFSYGFNAGGNPAGPPIPTSGGLDRPNVPDQYCLLGDDASNSATPITFPLGSTPKYTFRKVVQFDPEGLARTAPATPPTGSTLFLAQGVPAWMEFGLIPTRGNTVPNTASLFPDAASQNKGNHACLQIDGMKATVKVYRPGL